MKIWRGLSVVMGLFVATACGNGTTAADAGGSGDSGSGPLDTGVAPDSGAVDSGTTGAPLHDCAESDFIDLRSGTPDDRMIMVPTGTTMFDMPCVTISTGQEVMFMWDFSMHPLAAGVAPGHPGMGTTPTPIQPQTTGMLYTVAFPSEGNYPFYCTTHFHSGMMGVVRVMP